MPDSAQRVNFIPAGEVMFKLSSEAKVGLLVIVGAVVLLYMTFAVGKYEFGEKKGYTIQAVFDSVAGLDAKAAVRMAGVKIGVVEKVELDGNRARVILRIFPEIQVLRGTDAMIKTLGLLGERYVELVPVKGAKPGVTPPGGSAYLQDGEQIEATVSPSDADRLVNQLSSISEDIKKITESLSKVFGTERGAGSMEDILTDMRRSTANIQAFSYTLRSDGGELIMRLNELVASLNGVVGENRENLKSTIDNVRDAARSAERALASIDNTARKIDRGEGTIGKLVNDDSMYKNIDTAAKGVGDYTSRLERMQSVVAFRNEYMFPQSKSYFTLELKPKYDKYYIVEVIADPFAKYTRVVDTTSPPGSTTVTESYEDKFRFSVLFAKRWGNLALRLGLIENTGGGGVDAFAFNDRIKFSVDSWNMNSQEPGNDHAHMKATATYQFGKAAFVNGGYDNFLNSKRASAFAGIGLRFDDDDLKYLLGSIPIPK